MLCMWCMGTRWSTIQLINNCLNFSTSSCYTKGPVAAMASEAVAFVDLDGSQEPTHKEPAPKRLRDQSPAPTEIDPETDIESNIGGDVGLETLTPPKLNRPPQVGIKNDLAETCPLLAMWEAGPARDPNPLAVVGTTSTPTTAAATTAAPETSAVTTAAPRVPIPGMRQWLKSAKLDDLDDIFEEAVTFTEADTHDDVMLLEPKSMRIEFRHFGQHVYASLFESVQRLLSSGVTDCYIGLARDVWHRWCKMSDTKSRHHLRWQYVYVLCCTDVTHARWCERRLLRDLASEHTIRNRSAGGELSREGSDDVWLYVCVNFNWNSTFDLSGPPQLHLFP